MNIYSYLKEGTDQGLDVMIWVYAPSRTSADKAVRRHDARFVAMLPDDASLNHALFMSESIDIWVDADPLNPV